MNAKTVLRIIGSTLSVGGCCLIGVGASQLASVTPIAKTVGELWALRAGGLAVSLLGLGGPIRISTKSIPSEIAALLRVIGGGFVTIGVTQIVSSLFAAGEPLFKALAVNMCVSGTTLLLMALGGFFRTAPTMPDTFMWSEMVGVIKSAGLESGESIADREMKRLTGGKREGLPVGSAAPDGEVITQDGKSKSLKEYIERSGDKKRPIILNFGSYTCPHHRRRIPELNDLVRKWKDRCSFLTIYVTEAHPEDGWKIPGQYKTDEEYNGNDGDFCFFYAKSLDERLKMSNNLTDVKNLDMDVVCDTMTDTLMKLYNAWPIRLYVVVDGKITYTGAQGPFGYQPQEVEEHLSKLFK